MLPVLWKELRSRMRGAGTPVTLTLYVGLLGAVALAVLVFIDRRSGFVPPNLGEVTVVMYGLLSGLQLLLVALITPALTAGAIAGERERQTLDLLLATGLSSWGILAGKLAAALAFALLLMVASVPVFTVVFLIGGLPLAVFLQVLFLQFVTAFTLGCAGLLISTLTRRSGAATALSVALAILLLFGTLGAGLLQQIRREAVAQRVAMAQSAPARLVAVAQRGAGGQIVVQAPDVQPGIVQPRRNLLPSALYANPLVALVAAVVPSNEASVFGPVPIRTLKVPIWLLFSIIFLLLGAGCFVASALVLERRKGR